MCYSYLCESNVIILDHLPRPSPKDMCYGRTQEGKIMGRPRRSPSRAHDCEASTSTMPLPLSPSDVLSTSMALPPPRAFATAPALASPYRWPSRVQLTVPPTSKLPVSRIEFEEVCQSARDESDLCLLILRR